MKATISKSGKGWSLKFENGTTMSINWTNIPIDWDNSEIEVERIAGQPAVLKKGVTTLKKPSAPNVVQTDNRRDNDRGYQQKNQNQQRNNPPRANNIVTAKSAKSPYNFVPLNDKVVYPDEQVVSFDKYHSERNTGYINLEIETKTPIFIRGNNENFLLINGKPIIPGSSLRGLIRNMVGILSYSKAEFINDSRFFFRSFADSAIRLRTEYNQEITEHTNAGILYQKKDRNYVLVPSTIIGSIFDISLVNDCIFDSATNIWKLYSGSMPGGATAKRNNYEIKGRKIDGPGATVIKWDDDLIREYNDDITRKGFNVLKELKKSKYKTDGIPVFYQADSNGKISSFGNTKNYRLPYHETVKDHLHDCHHQKEFFDEQIEKLDFVNLIFGKTNDNKKDERTIATRVYFEDAICNSPQYDDICILKILASPKPTSFQLYLEQPNGVNTAKNQLKHWNDTDAPIRGFKQYWHKNDALGYIEIRGTTKPSSSHPDPVKPMGINNTFVGNIRFENLTDKELGALLYALDLPENCCHKIGVGKPLGLGSIRITPKLILDDRSKRYLEPFDANGNWNLPQKHNLPDFKKSFSEYIFLKVGGKQNDLWNIERLKQLKAMLEYDENLMKSPEWLEKTRYMVIRPNNEFKNRDVLDNPINIK